MCTTPTACKTPTLAVYVPRWMRAARTWRKEKRQNQSGAQVLTEVGIVPFEEKEVGGRGHWKAHMHVSTHAWTY